MLTSSTSERVKEIVDASPALLGVRETILSGSWTTKATFETGISIPLVRRVLLKVSHCEFGRPLVDLVGPKYLYSYLPELPQVIEIAAKLAIVDQHPRFIWVDVVMISLQE